MIRSMVIAGGVVLAFVTAASAQDPKAKGEKLFDEQKCTLCHSIAGKGNPKGPLDDAGSRLSPAEIRAWLTDAKGMTAKTKPERKPPMKQYTLAKEDVDALVAFVSSQKKK